MEGDQNRKDSLLNIINNDNNNNCKVKFVKTLFCVVWLIYSFSDRLYPISGTTKKETRRWSGGPPEGSHGSQNYENVRQIYISFWCFQMWKGFSAIWRLICRTPDIKFDIGGGDKCLVVLNLPAPNSSCGNYCSKKFVAILRPSHPSKP